jgi:hypothetical protein
MGGEVCVFETFDGDVRVTLRGLQRGVPQKLLDCAQVRTALKEVGCGGVAHSVWCDVRNTCGGGESMHGFSQ